MPTLTIYFDEPWWVGAIEFEADGQPRLVRHVFGAEPSGPEVLAFVQHDYVHALERPAATLTAEAEPQRHVNPRRAARAAARAMRTRGLSTKAQEALKQLHEQQKQERHVMSRAAREQHAAHKRQKAREKTLARRRGH